MTNLQKSLDSIQKINAYQIIQISGLDAKSFLQNLLTNDLDKANTQKGILAGFCNPKGRLQTSFWLTLLKDETYLIWISDDLAFEFVKKLSLYKLRSKVEIHLLDTTWNIYGVMNDQEIIDKSQANFICQLPSVIYENVEIYRYLMASQTPLSSSDFNDVNYDWNLLEVLSGIPRITQATTDQFVPQMINFESVGGIDFKKGCYPGQEIVARSQYLGSIKRRLKIGFVKYEINYLNLLVQGQKIYTEDEINQEVGILILSAYDKNKKGIYFQFELMLNFVGAKLFFQDDQLGKVFIQQIFDPPYPLLEI